MSTTATTTSSQALAAQEKGASLWSDAWARFKKNKIAQISLWYLIVVTLLALCAPLIAPYSYEAQDLNMGAISPNSEHWFGTDTLGRDLFTRVLYGARVSLAVGIVATLVSLVIGVLWGSISGYFGGKIDAIFMRIVDIIFTVPFIILFIILTVVFGKNFLLLFLAIGFVEWLTMARIVRGQVLSLRKQEFVEAAISIGLPKRWIISKHIIPNTLGTVIVYTTLTIPNVMLSEAVLSYLGLGVQPPMSSWGLLISGGVEAMEEYPWLLIFPVITFSLTLRALMYLGDGLRDALDPKASKD